jgi:pyruvate formate lyase activating enzyme
VYTGNVHDPDGGTTWCPDCGVELVVRDWYEITRYQMTDAGECPFCLTKIPGVYDGPVGTWGRRRLPVRVGR